ncbi:replication initiation protein [Vibrio marisflavi]|uniref:Initiator Rep protein WH1 domain-containing protein n=1 Tax=Vibrio marisflavi CECT 7928 TaxID=634439 RepID=A0ABM9A9E3_9VIBR|nr:replication initiation protein [Vibrio marisflavi]CAH0543108.1 hypothetical protein VMF7928_04404 [Vibrio marisflavi CECT 7928]
MNQQKKLPKHIKKGHQLVFSQQDLTTREANLFGLMMAHMTPADWESGSPEYRFTAAQLCEWLSINNRAVGSQLKGVVARLLTRNIGIVTDNKGDTEFEFTPLFSKAIYKDRVLTLKPNIELESEYIEYNKGFALIDTKSYLGLKREYTKRLYEMLSRFKNKGSKLNPIEIDDLRCYMGLVTESGQIKSDKGSFKNPSTVVRYCVKDSIAELCSNPKTNKELLFHTTKDGLGFKYHKNGRKIVAIEFIYSWINEANPIEKLNFEDAKRNITRLETKRLTTDEKLTSDELELLIYSYRSIGEEEDAVEIEKLLDESKQVKVAEKEQDKSFLDKIRELKRMEK